MKNEHKLNNIVIFIDYVLVILNNQFSSVKKKEENYVRIR